MHERRFLANPPVEFEEFNGRVVGAYVKLQDRKAVRDIQPNPDVPVFFYLDADGWPVGAKFYAHVEGYIVAKLLDKFIMDGDGNPHAMQPHVKCDFICTGSDVLAFMKSAQKATEKLEVAALEAAL